MSEVVTAPDVLAIYAIGIDMKNLDVVTDPEDDTERFEEVPQGGLKILFADKSKIIRPEEDPSLVFYSVNKQKGENPFQVQTLWFFLKFILLGGGLGVLTGIAGVMYFKPPSSAAPAPPESTTAAE